MRDTAFLKHCLVDEETGAGRMRRRTGRRALAAALVLEGMVIAGLLLCPWFTPATPPPPPWRLLAALSYVNRPLRSRPPGARAPGGRGPRAIPAPDFSHPPASPFLPARGAALKSVPTPVIGESGPGGLDGTGSAPAGFGGSPAALPAPGRVRVIRRSEQVERSQLITRVLPAYPEVARLAHITGSVELLVLVGSDGGVLSVDVLGGNPLLAAAAQQAVERWRYRPAILDGQPVEVEARVTVNFVMDQ